MKEEQRSRSWRLRLNGSKKLEVEIERVKGSLLTGAMTNKTLISSGCIMEMPSMLIPPIWKG